VLEVERSDEVLAMRSDELSGHQIYPYLLRGVSIEPPNQVWSTDITYIPMHGGFLYLVAGIDWFSRFVLSWELSNTMETGFCLAALEAAFRFGHLRRRL
jgi:putative transposase